MSPERRRLICALLLSLLIHGLVLSLRLEYQGLGIPGFGVPWRDRRIEVPDLRVVLVPAQVAVAEPALPSVAEAVRQELIVQPFAGVPTVTPSVAPAPILGGQTGAIVGKAKPAAKADDATGEAPANEHSRADGQGGSAPAPVPDQAVIALEQPVEETFVVPPARSVPTPVTAAAPSASSPAAVQRATQGSGDAALERIDKEARERTIELARLERAEREAQRQAERLAMQRDIDAAERLKRDEDFARQEAERHEAEGQRIAQQELAQREAAQSEAALREAARLEAARQEVARVQTARLEAARQQAARQEAALQEAARVETARLEAARQEEARQEEARQEAARQEAASKEREAARQDVARVETARLEAARQEAALQEAARQEAAGQEAARQEAARVETARLETARKEAARQELARVEEARLEAARQAAARFEAARQEASRLEEARLQVAQRQAEEAARREAASPAAAPAMGEQGSRSAQQGRADGSRALTTGREPSGSGAPAQAAPPPVAVGPGLPSRVPEASGRPEAQPAARMPATQATTSSGARRRTLFGRTDPNVDLVRYAEAWRQKIELNMTFDLLREAVKQPHANPLVTVALRSDGSVESVTFNRSSGVAQIDEAVRRVVHSQAPYQAFPSDLAREFDVIEIRRTWMFDMAIRLY